MRTVLSLAAVFVAGLAGLPSALAQQPARPSLVHREVVRGMPQGEQQEVQVDRKSVV